MGVQNKDGNKVLPFEVERGFIALPSAISEYYVRHPRFTPATERIYRYLLQRYNAKYGYAWPSWSAIIRDCNVSRGTVKSSLESLEHLELIKRFKFEKDGDWDNNGYRFIKPVESEQEFYRKYNDELPKKYQKEAENISEINTLERWL